MKKALLGAVALSLLASAQAQAAGFSLREQSAYGQGWSFAGAGAGGPGVSGMFWNPALVNSADRLTFDSSYTLVAPVVKITPDATFPLAGLGGSGEMGQDAIVPATAVAIPLNEHFTAGITMGAPFGLATNPRHNWSGQLDSYSSKVFTFNATPTLGWKVNEWLSLGVGLQMEFFKTTLKSNAGVGGPRLTIQGQDDVGFGWTAGVQLKPFEGTEIGLGYRSSITHDINGDVRVGAINLPIATTLKTPDIVNLGVRQRINNSFTVAASFEWQNWSNLGVLTASNSGSAIVPALPFNYRDSWFVSLGGEYQWNPDLALRAGVGYETSPLTNTHRTTRLPDADRIWLSAGLSYKWSDNLSVDVGYSYLFAADNNVRIDTATFNGKADSSAHILSVGMRKAFNFGVRSAFAAE